MAQEKERLPLSPALTLCSLRTALLCAPFAGYEPKEVVEALGWAMSLHRRRHHRAESADEKLDRLIAMERRARSSPPAEDRQPEMRRLRVVPEGNEAGAASASDGRKDETGRAGDATLAAGGRRAEVGGETGRGREVARPTGLPLELGPVPPAPSGMLAPLCDNVRQGPGSVGGRALLAGDLQYGPSGQVQGGDHGNGLRALDGQMVRRGHGEVNPFWSAEVRREVATSGQGRLPGDVQLTRNLQPVMDAAGSGRSGQDLDEGELERIRQRVLREAEENFKMEIRKLRGEGGTDSRSYHSASSGGDQGAPRVAQGDRADMGSGTTPSRGDRVGLASVATPVQGGGAASGILGPGAHGVVSPPGLDQRGFLYGGGAPGGHGESLRSCDLPVLPAPGRIITCFWGLACSSWSTDVGHWDDCPRMVVLCPAAGGGAL